MMKEVRPSWGGFSKVTRCLELKRVKGNEGKFLRQTLRVNMYGARCRLLSEAEGWKGGGKSVCVVVGGGRYCSESGESWGREGA